MSLRVFIAHKRKEADSAFEKMLKAPQFNLCYAVDGQNGEEVANEIIAKKPDFIVIDAVMSRMDAEGVLEKINASGVKTMAIVLMSGASAYLESALMKSGAAYVLLKPVRDELICKRIIGMSEAMNSSGKTGTSTIEAAVTGIIHELGVPAHIKGYDFLRRAIMLCIADERLIHSVTKVLYPEVAKHYETTPSRVERAIRHAIEVCFDRGDVETLENYFGYTIKNSRGKPTNSEFIALISDNMRMKLGSMN